MINSQTNIDPKLQKLIAKYDAHCNRLIKKASSIKQEDPKEKEARKKKLEKIYTDWFEFFFDDYAKVKCARFHKKLAKLIIEKPIVNVLAEIYRSGAKSVHINLGIPLYLYLVKRDLFFMLLVGQTELKAKKLLSDIQANLKHNPKIIAYYGKRYKTGSWVNGDFTTSDGVKFFAIGYGQNPRGIRELSERPDYITVDDIDTKMRVKNNKLSREATEWVWEDLKGTFDEGSPRQRFVVANNNFHKNTVINRLKIEFKRINKISKEYNDPIQHFTLTVPAVKNLETFEPNWPEKTNTEYWRRKYRQTPYRSFMREYMHKHIVEGTIFGNDDVLFKKRYKYSQYDGLVFYFDLSYKDAGDHKGGMFLGKKNREYNILGVFNRQTSNALCAEWLYNLYEDKHLENYPIDYYIEGLFAMDEFVNDFDEEGDKRGYHIPVEPDTDRKGNKYDRIEAMSGHYKRKSIYIDAALKEDPDTMLYVEHLLAFEKGSTTPVDILDAQQGGISKLNKVTFVDKFDSRITTRKDHIKHKKNRF